MATEGRERVKKSRTLKLEAGGRRLEVFLTKNGSEALDKIKASVPQVKTNAGATEFALVTVANALESTKQKVE